MSVLITPECSSFTDEIKYPAEVNKKKEKLDEFINHFGYTI
jgi:hypothetical protein